MKKIVIFVISTVILIGGAWWGYGFLSTDPASDNNQDINNNDVVTLADDILKSQALSIAHQPFIVKKNLPQSTIDLAKNKIDQAVKLIEDNYDYDAPWLDLGAYRRLVGDYDGAIAAWNFLTAIRPNAYVPYHNLGDLYAFTLNDHIKGESYFLKSIEIGEGNVPGYLLLTTLYTDSKILNKQSQIPALLLSGLDKNSQDINLLVALANYYKGIGNKDLALKYFSQALKVDPNSVSIKREIDELNK